MASFNMDTAKWEVEFVMKSCLARVPFILICTPINQLIYPTDKTVSYSLTSRCLFFHLQIKVIVLCIGHLLFKKLWCPLYFFFFISFWGLEAFLVNLCELQLLTLLTLSCLTCNNCFSICPWPLNVVYIYRT